MILSTELELLIAAVLVLVSILVSKTSFRFGVPVLLMFLLVGMVFGTDGLGLEFDDVKGAQSIGTVALCIILFSGGMDTQLKQVRPILGQGIVLSTAGVLLTTLITGLFVYLLSSWAHYPELSFGFLGALLLAATMSSTDSASVFNILRSQKINLKYNLRPMLELESGSNDPMAFMLTIILIQCVQMTGTTSAGGIFVSFLLQFAVGIVGGVLIGMLGSWIINHIHLKNGELYSLLVISFVFITYCSVYLLRGNGFLAVYVAGIMMGNGKLFKKKEITAFMDGVTWLVQIVMFLLLGLLVNPHEMFGVALSSVLIGIFIIFVARPISVWLCLLPFGKRVTHKSKLFVSWVGLRGAAPIIFATYPVIAGVEGANIIFNIVFFVTLLSLIVQGTSISWMARKLDLVAEEQENKINFGIELPDELRSSLYEMTDVSQIEGKVLRNITFPKGVLVMMIKRDDNYFVPNGETVITAGDRLLLIKADRDVGHSVRKLKVGSI